MRRAFLLVLVATLCFSAESGWQTATSLPKVEMSGLSPSVRNAVLAILRTEGCTCGCSMKIAECRMMDPECPTSRRLANFAVQEAYNGKSAEVVRANLVKFAAQ